MDITHQLDDAGHCLRAGGLIAYPTEAVYGLGCDPFNEEAVTKLLALKMRPMEKGLILLIADWQQLSALISDVSLDKMAAVRATWPGPVTWIFPKSTTIPVWLSGHHPGIAIRMSAHPVAHALCVSFGAIVSTSANIAGRDPARDISDLHHQFPKGIDALVPGGLGNERNPSAIYDVLSGKRLR